MLPNGNRKSQCTSKLYIRLQIASKYAVMLRDTELCLQPPAMSICVIVPEGGWHRCQPFHEAHHPLFGQISHGAFFPFRPPFATGRGGDSGHRAHTLSSPHPPTGGLTRGRSEGLELLSDILMSGRPDQIIFNV